MDNKPTRQQRNSKPQKQQQQQQPHRRRRHHHQSHRDEEEEHLLFLRHQRQLANAVDEQVRRIVAIRREVVADFQALESGVRRLGFDVRRLDSSSSSVLSLPSLVSRALAVVGERRRWFLSLVLDSDSPRGGGGMRTATTTVPSKEDLLRLFTRALSFVQEARGVLAFCERGVTKWNFNPHRGRECAAEMGRALRKYFPGVGLNSDPDARKGKGEGEETEMKYSSDQGGLDDARNKTGGGYGMPEQEILQKLIRDVEVVPYHVEEPMRWKNYSTYY